MKASRLFKRVRFLKNENVRELINSVKELNASYNEALSLMKGSLNEIREFKRLLGAENGAKSGLVKLGIAFIMFPEPTPFSELIGCGLVATGLVYSHIKPPPIYIRDVYSTIEKELDVLRRGI